MSRTLLSVGIALAASACLCGAASAGTLLYDNFNADTPQLNWAGDSTFTSTSPPKEAPPASTDLVGPTFFNLCAPGQGNCVDLDGSTGYGNEPDAGQLTSNTSFGPGTYTLVFSLAGNERGAAPETTEVSLGSFSKDLTLASTDPWATHSYTFTTATGGNLQFTDFGPSDQQGNLLDNVALVAGVPEPASWAFMLLGIGAIGAGLRTRRGAAVRSAIA